MMTAVAEPTKTQAGVGRVVRVIGPVVDAEFPRDAMPDIYNALHVDVTLSEGTKTLTLEVAQHLGDNVVRAISMQPTDGLVRGSEVRDTGSGISVPVGDVTKGHVFNALGEFHVHVQRVVDLRHRVARELGVDDRADDPGHPTHSGLGLYFSRHHTSLPAAASAFAPPTISLISWVIAA